MDSVISTLIVGIIVLLIISAAVFLIVHDRITGRSGCEKGCLVCKSCNKNANIDEDGKKSAK